MAYSVTMPDTHQVQGEARNQGAQAQPGALPAILLLISAVAMFSLSDVTSKVLRGTLPAVEVAWMRYLVFALVATGLAARGRFVGLVPRRPGLQVLRGVAVLGSAMLFITGLGSLPVAEATAIVFASPAFITALSIPFLGEAVGPRRWAAVLAGLAGVVIVIRPGGGAIQAAALFPLLSALCWAVAIIATRRMGAGDRTETTLLWSAVVGLVAVTGLVPFGFVTPSAPQVAIGVLLGLGNSLGQYLTILAYRRAPASLLAPFSYAQLLFTTALGYAVFGSVPDRSTLLGGAVIVGSGLYTAHRERVRARERRKGVAGAG